MKGYPVFMYEKNDCCKDMSYPQSLFTDPVNKSVYLMIHCIYLQCTDTVFYRYNIQKNKQIHTNFEQAKQAKRYACL